MEELLGYIYISKKNEVEIDQTWYDSCPGTQLLPCKKE